MSLSLCVSVCVTVVDAQSPRGPGWPCFYLRTQAHLHGEGVAWGWSPGDGRLSKGSGWTYCGPGAMTSTRDRTENEGDTVPATGSPHSMGEDAKEREKSDTNYRERDFI